MIELAVFLGNPGREYAGSRHNTGWLLAQKLPFYGDLDWHGKFKGLYAAMESTLLPPRPSGPPDGEAGGGETGNGETSNGRPAKLHFLMPETFMNLSGESVGAAASFFKIPPDRILAVHDELELPLGSLSLKFSGGLGGHNGLRSLKERLGNAGFWRLRIGIGRPGDRLPGEGGPPGSGRGIAGWVLSPFNAAERPVLDHVLDAAAALFIQALICGPESLLPEWNKKKVFETAAAADTPQGETP